MSIDNRTRSILIDKLHFTPANLSRLENNQDLLSKTLGLITLIRQANHPKEKRVFIGQQLKKIRQTLERSPVRNNFMLRKERALFYTFHRFAG